MLRAEHALTRTERGMEPRRRIGANRSKKANGSPCKRHPKHRQSPGVCSICLKEKLAQLSGSDSSSSSSRAARSGSSSSSLSSYASSLSSSNASSCTSPAVDFRRRLEPDARDSSVRFFGKSRSMAFVTRRRKEEPDRSAGEEVGIGKGGFWSKFLPRKTRGLTHSKTTRERIVTSSLH